MAHIRVEGVGGLGMVLMAIAVALGIPQVGKSMAAGLLLGALMAVVLIRWRRAAGPMPSSGQRPGANTTLAIDAPDSAPAPQTTDGRARRHGSSPRERKRGCSTPRYSWSPFFPALRPAWSDSASAAC